MRSLALRWFVGVFCCVVCAACSAGCGGSKANPSRYVPKPQTARAALETALTAWQHGEHPGHISATSPTIKAIDSKWQGGQKLASYQITAEQEQEDSKQFSVRLTFKNSTQEQEVRYVVVGQDPVFVFLEEDYRKVQGM